MKFTIRLIRRFQNLQFARARDIHDTVVVDRAAQLVKYESEARNAALKRNANLRHPCITASRRPAGRLNYWN